MKCPYCGQENRDTAKFCQYCGRPLAAEPTTEAQVPGAAPSKPVDQKTGEPETTAGLEEKEPVAPEKPTSNGSNDFSRSRDRRKGLEKPSPPDESAVEPATTIAPTESPDRETPSAEVGESAPPSEKVLAEVEPPAEIGEGAAEDDTLDRPMAAPVESSAAQEAPESTAEMASPELAPLGEEEMTTAEFAPEVQELEQADLLPWSDKPPATATLEPNVVLNGRYQVIEVLSTDEDNIYRVRDLQRCPRCGFAGNSPTQAFCASCGAALDQKPEAILLERSPERAGEAVEAEVEDHFELNGRLYWVWRETRRQEIEEIHPHMRLAVGLRSVTGQVRELDEDSLFTMIMSRTHESITGQLALFIVADGMGGHEGGEVASKTAIQAMADVLVRNVFLPELEGHPLPLEEICHWMERAMSEANDRVYLARQKRNNDMGTTMTAALLKDWSLCLAHVGDCRAYRWGTDGLEQLTTDHSIVASMIAAGAAKPEEIYTHPQRSVIYRCIGDRPTVEIDISMLTLSPGDRLILCCDGLWEMIHNEGIEEVMLREADPQKACDIMVEQANMAGGTDNISVIVVQL